MKRMSRILSVIMAVIMIAGLLPMAQIADLDFSGLLFNASAADIVGSGTCGENATWVLDNDGLLTITGTGAVNGYAFQRIEAKKAVIQDGITVLDSYLFCGNEYLEELSLPMTLSRIEDSVFKDCDNIRVITIPNVTSLVGQVFAGCDKLETIYIGGDIDTIYGVAFYDCPQLKNISLPASIAKIIVDRGNPVSESIEDIYFDGTIDQWESIQMENTRECPNPFVFGTIHCNDGSISHTHQWSPWCIILPSTSENNNGWGMRKCVTCNKEEHSDQMHVPAETNICGENATWGFENGTLTISGTGALYMYEYWAPWAKYAKNIENIIIEEGITKIGDFGLGAFYTKSINLPSSLEMIYIFGNNWSLERLVIPENVKYIAGINVNSTAQEVVFHCNLDVCHSDIVSVLGFVNPVSIDNSFLAYAVLGLFDYLLIDANGLETQGYSEDDIYPYSDYQKQIIHQALYPFFGNIGVNDLSIAEIFSLFCQPLTNIDESTKECLDYYAANEYYSSMGYTPTVLDYYTFIYYNNFGTQNLPTDLIIKGHNGPEKQIAEQFGLTYEEIHIWDAGVTTEPTCTEVGSKTFTCTVCGAIIEEDEPAPALGHIDVDPKDDYCDRCGICLDYGEFLTTEISSEKYWLTSDINHDIIRAISGNIENGPIYYWAESVDGYLPLYEVDLNTTAARYTDEYRAYLLENGISLEEMELSEEDTSELISVWYHYVNPPVPANVIPETIYIGENNCPNTCIYWYLPGDSGSDDPELSIYESDDGSYLLMTLTEYVYEQGEDGVLRPTEEKSGYSRYGAYIGSERYDTIFGEAFELLHEPLGHIDEDGDGVCDRCGETVADACAHENTGIRNAVAATCTEPGYMGDTYCLDCGEQIEVGETIDALGHDYCAVVTAPTCEERGYATYTCSRCGDSYVDDYTDALGHDWGAWTEDGDGHKRICKRNSEHIETEAHDWQLTGETTADCTTPGTADYECSGCGATKTVTGEALGHGYDLGFDEEEVLSTCSVKGYYRKICLDCGDIIENKIYELDTNNHKGATEIRNASDPTCEANGYSGDTYCLACGAKIAVGAPIDALGHDFGEWTVTTEPDCAEKGVATRYCSRCDAFETREVDELGHDYVPVVTAPTCTEQGYTTYTCSRCGDSYVDDYTDALGHDFGEWTVTTEPDCAEKGVATRYCSRCDAFETKEVDELGHDYVPVVTAPTCTEQGYTIYTCSRCGDSYVDDYTDALGHGCDLGFDEEEVLSTCSVKGYYRKICLDCGEIIENRIYELDQTNHKGATEIRNANEPTCTDDGYTGDTYCLACGNKIADGEPIEALGHDFGEWTVTTAPDCVNKGEATRYCSRCDAFETEEADELGHNYVTVVTAPTCEERGYTTYTCSRCGDSHVDDYTDALGHDYVPVVTGATCEEQGYTTYTCSRCGDSYVDSYADALGHDWGNWTVAVPATCTDPGIETKRCKRDGCNETETRASEALGHDYAAVVTAPTCEARGYTTHTCSRCSDSYVDSYTDALGHDWGNWTVTTPATCTEGGEESRSCKRDGCNETETRAIVALGHDWGEWTVVKEATYLHEGQKVRVCSRCPEKETGVIEKLTPDETNTDDVTGSQLAFQEDVVPADTEIIVDEEFDGVYFQLLNREKGNVQKQLFNITLESNGERVQPDGYVLVRIPIPANFNPAYTTVYYIASDGTGMQKLESYVENGYVCFETTHFSEYAIVDESPAQTEPETPVSNCACGQYHTGFFAPIIKFFHSIIYFFKNLFK
ncbi:MAG: leucine-rich repeat protein [Clostridia bacterium]|nr:leucine-rich repeat protein [Clostridia bacterium]